MSDGLVSDPSFGGVDGDLGSDPAGGDRRAPGARAPQARSPRWKRQSHYWLRWAHVYTSMIALVAVLFFGLTGITLNHPTWTLGTSPTEETVEGTLPATTVVDGSVELLAVSQYVRSAHGVGGEISDFELTEGGGRIAYRGPGYAADVTFETDSLAYTLTVEEQGLVAVMNDLHKGRDTPSAWRWVIDVSGALLVVIGCTGLGLQLFLHRRRRRALTWAVVGGVTTVVVVWLAMA